MSGSGAHMNIQRVGFVSTRLAGMDGVSLETNKWQSVLERLGHTCFAFVGQADGDPHRTMVVPLAHFEHPDVAAATSALFGSRRRARAVSRLVRQISETLVADLYEFIERFEIDLLIPENALAIPMHVPLGGSGGSSASGAATRSSCIPRGSCPASRSSARWRSSAIWGLPAWSSPIPQATRARRTPSGCKATPTCSASS
jgi:hypothetical protein